MTRWSLFLTLATLAHLTGCATVYSTVRDQDYRALEELLASGADPNAVDAETGELPLEAASRSTSVGLVRLLLEHGARPELPAGTNRPSPLCLGARDLDVVKDLLERGANPNPGTCSPLCEALEHGAARSAQLLQSRGARSGPEEARCALVHFPLDPAKARDRGDLEVAPAVVATALAANPGFEPKGLEGQLALMALGAPLQQVQGWIQQALGGRTGDEARRFLDEKQFLHLATLAGSPGLVAWLLDLGADVNALAFGRTALFQLRGPLSEGQRQAVDVLLARGADAKAYNAVIDAENEELSHYVLRNWEFALAREARVAPLLDYLDHHARFVVRRLTPPGKQPKRKDPAAEALARHPGSELLVVPPEHVVRFSPEARRHLTGLRAEFASKLVGLIVDTGTGNPKPVVLVGWDPRNPIRAGSRLLVRLTADRVSGGWVLSSAEWRDLYSNRTSVERRVSFTAAPVYEILSYLELR